MNEDVLFPKINTENTDFKIQMEIMNQIKKEILNKIKKEWKNIDNNLLKRVEYSKFHGTEWAWDVIQPSTEQHPIIQPPPVMSVLGWLIYMYEPPIVSKFLEINANMKLNMKSQEQTGLDYVSPIHLAVKYHNDSEYTEELLKELLNRGASLEQKTSHGWYPIHYACRYSPKLVSWVILNSENKDKHANMPLYFYPSCNTLKIAKQKLEWYQTWLPLNIFILNHCNTYDDSMIKIMNHIINYGGKRTMDELREATGKDNSVFEYDGPIGFNIGTTIINTVLPNNPKSKNIKKRKLRHV
jgi:hypothetical protein